MTLIALTQEPEVKVRLAMIGQNCSKQCVMLRHHYEGHWNVHRPACALYDARGRLARDANNEYVRHPDCIAAHGGAE